MFYLLNICSILVLHINFKINRQNRSEVWIRAAIVFFCVYPCYACTYKRSSRELQVQEAPGREEAPGPTGISGTMEVSVKPALNESHLHCAGCAPPSEWVEGLEGQGGIYGSC